MNRRLLDPFKSVGLPETIDEYLHCGTTTCLAFNRRGTLLAAGTKEGQVVYWDVDTRGVARIDTGHRQPVLSVSWTRDGRFLASCCKGNSVILWDVLHGTQAHTVEDFGEDVVGVAVHPLQEHIVLIIPKHGPPQLRDLRTHTTTVSDTQLDRLGPKHSTTSQPAPTSRKSVSTVAVFSKSGDKVFAGTSKGHLLVFQAPTMSVLDVVKLPGAPKVLGMWLSRKGDRLLLNCSDKVVRLYSISHAELPPLDAQQVYAKLEGATGIRHGSLMERSTLTWQRDFSNAVERVQWHGACFSSDGEYVVGAAGTSNEHNMYIWNCLHGKLERILEGPKPDSVSAVLWHPLRSALVSLATSGRMLIWTKIYQENWSAFAPGDFQELEENQEYVEREDEFDYNDIEERVAEGKRLRHRPAAEDEEEEEVDIVAAEHVAMLSSDDEAEAKSHLLYLPVRVEPDEEAGPNGLENGGGLEIRDAGEDEDEDLDGDDDQDPSEPEQLVMEGPRKRKVSRYLGDNSDYVPLSVASLGGRRRKS